MANFTDVFTFLHDSPVQDRRKFLRTTGKGILAATVLSTLATDRIHAQQVKKPLSGSSMKETEPVKLGSLDAPSERPKPAPPAPLRPDRRIGFAFVDLGHLTLNQLLPAVAKCQQVKIAALVSGDAEKARKVGLQYGVPETHLYNYQNFDTLKNNPDVDVVYIVLPNSMHEEFTIRAAKAGKHVLCEKPMATNSAAAQRMIDACKGAGRKLMIAYRVQYTPHHRQCMKWAREQHYGRVRIIDAINAQNIGDPGQWRLKRALSGGGSLPDIGIYNLNTARFLLGEEPEMVSAQIFTTPGDERFKEVEETVVFQLFFPSGAVSSNVCSYGIHEHRAYHCHGDKGGTFGVLNAFTYNGLEMDVSEVRDEKEWKSHPGMGAEPDQFALEMDHFADCILNNKRPYTPGEEGLQDHKIMEALYESARTGKPVKLERITQVDAFRGDALAE